MRCLRPKWDPDNFSCSHRCTSDVRPWSGACPVLIAPARPAFLCLPLGLLRSPSVLPFTPISSSLVCPQLRQIVFRPEPQSYTGNCLDGWGRNLPVPNPTMERAPVNSEQSCRFRNGVSPHSRMSHGVTFVKKKDIGEPHSIKITLCRRKHYLNYWLASFPVHADLFQVAAQYSVLAELHGQSILFIRITHAERSTL
jgi:hypothetical protein